MHPGLYVGSLFLGSGLVLVNWVRALAGFRRWAQAVRGPRLRGHSHRRSRRRVLRRLEVVSGRTPELIIERCQAELVARHLRSLPPGSAYAVLAPPRGEGRLSGKAGPSLSPVFPDHFRSIADAPEADVVPHGFRTVLTGSLLPQAA